MIANAEFLVSILIPCYNANRWIEEAINSALSQTYSNIEVIVVDDGSTDCSLEIIQSFGSQIHWETWENRGGNATRNRLLELSQGSWLQYLDADDYLLPPKVEQQLQLLAQNPDTDLIYSPSIIQHHHQHQGQEQISQTILTIPQPHDPWSLLARWYLPQTGSALWRKEAIAEVGGWQVDQPCCQEHELYLRLLQAGKKFSYCDYGGSIYRQWSESTVCKRDMKETYRRRLAITDRLEQHLLQTQQLTKFRQNQISQARFECARIIWLSDSHWAKQIIADIDDRDHLFIPSGACAPQIYRLMYRWFGFEVAETIAAMKRQLVFRSC
jgi:glycosyltransferase involved in cell wall biosynthesis